LFKEQLWFRGAYLYDRTGNGADCGVGGWVQNLGDEAAADANGVFAELPAPNALEIHADWREDRHVKNGEEHVGDAFCAGKVEGDAAKAEVHDAGAVSGLVSKYGVCVCARHRDALRFARHGVDARFLGNDSERGLRGLQR
jgi:hypothetical protein